MPGEHSTPEPAHDEQSLRPDLERMYLAGGAEAKVEQLGKEHVVKTLYDRDPQALAEHRRYYDEARKLFPDRVTRTLFVRSKDAEGQPANLMVQERVEGQPLGELADLPERLQNDKELAEDLIRFSQDVGRIIDTGRALPDLNTRNLLVEQPGRHPRVKLIDFGSPDDLRFAEERLGGRALISELYQDLLRQFTTGVADKADKLALPVRALTNLQYAFQRADTAGQQLLDWQAGTWSPTDEVGVHGEDDPTFKPIQVVEERHKQDVQWMLRHADSPAAFKREFVRRYGDELRKTLLEAAIGSDVKNPNLQRKLTDALFGVAQ